MEKIFDDYGIEVLKEEGKYYIKYDAGEIVQKIDEIEVSEEDAKLAQRSSEDAYVVILKYQ
jgi:hypothetical protein